MVSDNVPSKYLPISILAICCMLGVTIGPGLASENALRGPISAGPQYLKLDAEVARGASVLKEGSVFPVTLLTKLDSKAARLGDAVEAMLLVDLVVNQKIIAPRGSRVSGWINSIHRPRNVLESKVTANNWLNANGAISIHFSRIDWGAASRHPHHLDIDAQPAPGTPLRGPQHEHELCVHNDGCISVKWSGIKYSALGLTIGAVSWATGPFKLITGPVLSGTAGVLKPEYALDKPVLKNDALTRTKGGLVGAVKGLPGGFIVTGVANRGGYIVVPSGVQLEVQLVSDLVIPAER